MTSAQPDTEELVRRAGTGDSAAVHELFERHRSRLSRMIQVRMDPRIRGRVDPSDVIQDALILASQRLARFVVERPLPFYAWLRQIAWEKLVQMHERHLRVAKRTVVREEFLRPGISDESVLELAAQLADGARGPSAVLVRKELQGRVRKALDEISAEDREVLLQRYLEHLPSKEIGAILGISEAAVNMRHMRALEKLRRILAEAADEV
jgi:RNA polymerase sigma-70 factor (ECF subfamily)